MSGSAPVRSVQELGYFVDRPEVPLGHEPVQFIAELHVPVGIPEATDRAVQLAGVEFGRTVERSIWGDLSAELHPSLAIPAPALRARVLPPRDR